VHDRLVAVTEPYNGHRRMTLTYPALARANQLLWLITHAEDRASLSLLLGGDTSIPAGRVRAEHSLIMSSRVAVAP
jgi:6-phosphogluconolactonase